MSSFFSRCLICGVDLPRGCSFCTEAHKLRWHAEHDEEARPVVMTDEWPLVERETVVSGAEDTVSCGGSPSDGTSEPDKGRARSTVRSLPPSRLHNEACLCKHCTAPTPF